MQPQERSRMQDSGPRRRDGTAHTYRGVIFSHAGPAEIHCESKLLFNLFNPMGKFSSNKSGDICQSTAVDDVNGSPPAPDSSSTFNHSL
ncbi:hypothetical protein F2P81_001524 [Scophthalmus maximus]|uniref:Uncharacterized protein n=1 Tax=Scophthalmus maximus TaxID=52904 RepID=A0A6A4TIB2_SCOMX|nr:hypothetical protein F2P81_001524 [Scophthalmus maximus]